MKVKYTKAYTDEYGDFFQAGWVAEHTDPEGARRIALGVCVEVDKDARSLKYQPDAELSIEGCVDDLDAKSPLKKSEPLVVASK